MICLFGSAQERSPATARATSASAAEAITPCAYRRFASELAITSSGEPLDRAELALTARSPQSADQVETLSTARRIMSALIGCRDIHGRMLSCGITVGQTWSATR